MQILSSRCCGITVHQDSVTACVLGYSETPELEVRKKEFATHKQALGNLRLWWPAQQVTPVARESTSVYWQPVGQAREGNFESMLAHPYRVKNLPGRKTDARDRQGVAELLAHGLIRPSFVPPRETRNLRDLTRYRVQLVEEHNRIHNRIHKVLEDACIQFDTIATDIPGVSGRRPIQAILDGYDHPMELAERVQGTRRGKIPELRLARNGRITDHHRFLLRESREDLERVAGKIQRLEKEIAARVDRRQVERWCSIPGVDTITAGTLPAELGTDRNVFPSPKQAASGAGLCPGHHESGGKRLSNRTRQGNRWLRRALCPSAWGASRQKNGYLMVIWRPSFIVTRPSRECARRSSRGHTASS